VTGIGVVALLAVAMVLPAVIVRALWLRWWSER